MKCVMVLLLSAVISGCYTDMNRAHSDYQCRDKGGVYSYGNEFLKIKCKNGESIDYGAITPLPKGWRVGEK